MIESGYLRAEEDIVGEFPDGFAGRQQIEVAAVRPKLHATPPEIYEAVMIEGLVGCGRRAPRRVRLW